MKVLVIGGVAAGTKAAAKLKREDGSAQVKILTKGQDISYAGCGLPYYVGGLIGTREELIVNSPEKYAGLTGAEVVTGCEVTAVNAAAHTVTARKDGQAFEESYDRLVIATGAEPIVPDMPGAGLPGVFCMRTPDDAVGLLSYVKANGCRRAAVVGAGFIGLETAENLMAQGLSVTVIDAAPQVMPNAFDSEMAEYVKRKLRQAGMRVQTGCRIEAVSGTARAEGIATSAGPIAADVVVLAIGLSAGQRRGPAERRRGCGRVHAHQCAGCVRGGRLRAGEKHADGQAAMVCHGLHREPCGPRTGKNAGWKAHCLRRLPWYGRCEAATGFERGPHGPDGSTGPAGGL